MSLTEIKGLIKEKGLQPRLIEDAMMKELTWDDQWIGYDDEETVALKKKFANNYCFGGTMAWSVDFNSGTGDSDSAPVSTDSTCGVANGGATCAGTTFGKCCSAAGYCGSTDAHCGSGCQSGECLKGAVTTDGSCGVGANGAVCGSWVLGDCCSSSGWCGNTDAHCGTGCQSGSCTKSGSSSSQSKPTATKSSVPSPTETVWDINTSWDDYYENNQKCIFFNPPQWDITQSMCDDICAVSNEANKESGAKVTSATCIGFWPGKDAIPWEDEQVNDSSKQVAAGACTCDNPAVNWAAETFVDALPEVGQVRSDYTPRDRQR